MRTQLREVLNKIRFGVQSYWLFTRARLGRVDLRTEDDSTSYPKIFITGCPRSGTSWVQNMFGDHPAVITHRESHAYYRIHEPMKQYGCRDPRAWGVLLLHDHLFRNSGSITGLHHFVSRRALTDLIVRTLRQLNRRTGWGIDEATRMMVAGIFDPYFMEQAGPGDQKVFVEKTPQHLDYAREILNHFPEAKIIDVRRDGRDVCVSMQMRAERAAWSPASRDRQITLWKDAIEKSLRLGADPALADRFTQVRYEDLKRHPEGELKKLFTFAGLDYDDDLIRTIAADNDIGAVPADKKGRGRHVRDGAVGDWRNHFTAEDEALFRQTIGDLFEKAGYAYDHEI